MGYIPNLKGNTVSSFPRSPTDVGRTNLFQMDIPTMGLPTACQPYQLLLKYQKFINEEIRLLENVGCRSKGLSPGATPVIKVPKSQTPQILKSNSSAYC